MESLQKEKFHKKWNLSTCNNWNNCMVREIDVRWNTLQISIELMYAKLVKLGFVYEDGKIKPP